MVEEGGSGEAGLAAGSNAGLATVRGIELTCDDRMRAQVIEKIMCSFGFDFLPLRAEFGEAAEAVIAEARALRAAIAMASVRPRRARSG